MCRLIVKDRRGLLADGKASRSHIAMDHTVRGITALSLNAAHAGSTALGYAMHPRLSFGKHMLMKDTQLEHIKP